MKRRQVLKGIAAGSAMSVGIASGETQPQRPTHVAWTFDDGTQEVIELGEFHHRSDTPSLRELETDDDCVAACCDCIRCDLTCTGGLCTMCEDCVGCGCCEQCENC